MSVHKELEKQEYDCGKNYTFQALKKASDV